LFGEKKSKLNIFKSQTNWVLKRIS